MCANAVTIKFVRKLNYSCEFVIHPPYLTPFSSLPCSSSWHVRLLFLFFRVLSNFQKKLNWPHIHPSVIFPIDFAIHRLLYLFIFPIVLIVIFLPVCHLLRHLLCRLLRHRLTRLASSAPSLPSSPLSPIPSSSPSAIFAARMRQPFTPTNE